MAHRLLAPVTRTKPVIKISYGGVEVPDWGFQILIMNGWDKGSHDLCAAIRNDQPKLTKSTVRRSCKFIQGRI